MQHWYVYHSQETMSHPYASLGEHAVYSKQNQPKLCFNDVIWVVEGDSSTPKNFTLVDCFQYKNSEYPPFKAEYSAFKLKVSDTTSLLESAISLSKDIPWFEDLHQRFITKQRFFL
ncbi:hypothetical protein HNQ57_002815 [Zhongshania antarctica]|uniref:Uncharacterized protein n=1 Tax=Zhongshania antarctica TaxID=641702 RepID=A0A840R7U3_9GAMM|nr:hypothetical protein [Zhongshania antarctica]